MIGPKLLFEILAVDFLDLLPKGVDKLLCPCCSASFKLKYFWALPVRITKPKPMDFISLECPVCSFWAATIEFDIVGLPVLHLRPFKR